MKTKRKTLSDVRRDVVKSRLADLVAWRMALRQFWRPVLVWRSLKFRWQNRKRRGVLFQLLEKQMSPDWRCSLPKKQQRAMGMISQLKTLN